MASFYRCLSSLCDYSVIPLYAEKKFIIRHYRNKPIEIIIQLAEQFQVCKNPRIENFETLASLLADRSEIKIWVRKLLSLYLLSVW